MSSAEVAASVSNKMFTKSATYAVKRDAIYNGAPSRSTETQTAIADIRKAEGPSTRSKEALEAISQSRLSRGEKEDLVRLAAFIDEKEDGNTAFMRDLETLVHIMELNADGSEQGELTVDEAHVLYDTERTNLRNNDVVNVSFDVAFEGFGTKYISAKTDNEKAFLLKSTQDDIGRAFNFANSLFSGGVMDELKNPFKVENPFAVVNQTI